MRLQQNQKALFFGTAAQLIRRILIDYARAHRAAKRGGKAERLSLDEAAAVPGAPDLDLVALDDALADLAKIDPRQSRLVELRFFAGLTLEEAAELLQITAVTARRDWVTAKAWLAREIHRRADHSP